MITDGDKLLKNIADATEHYAQSVANEMSVEDGRTAVKMAAVQRIMAAGDNPMTNKPHSFSSAEAIVNTDRDYSDYLAKLRETVSNRILARGRYESALLEAQLVSAKFSLVSGAH